MKKKVVLSFGPLSLRKRFQWWWAMSLALFLKRRVRVPSIERIDAYDTD